MKRNILIALLMLITICFLTACGSTNNDVSKFEGTWIAYDKNGAHKQSSGDAILEMTIDSIKNQVLISIYSYEYIPLLDYYSSGLSDVSLTKKTGETAEIHADYLLQKIPSSTHNSLSTVNNNQIILTNSKSSKADSNSILYNEKDNTLIMGDIVFTKQTDTNTIQSHLSALQDALKAYCQKQIDEHQANRLQQPKIQVDYSFDNSILNLDK